jgi:hypothetical protein
MRRTKINHRRADSPKVYYPEVAPRSAIRRFARQIVERFQPDKIILFGSYFKGLLAESALPIQKTHDLTILLLQLIPTDPTLRALGRGLKGMTRYAVEYRYPGMNTTSRQARSAFAKALVVRAEIRRRLGLRTRRFK